MGATQPARRVVNILSPPLRVVLVMVAGLVVGCGTTHTSSVFHAAAPLPSDITIPYAVGGSNPPTTPGLTGLKGRDGSNAWHAATGEPNSQAPSPLEVNGVIYTEGGSVHVSDATGTLDQVGTVAAVRASDGHILWQVPLPTGSGTDDRDFHIATDGTTVLVTDPTAGLYALSATTGAVRWHRDEPVTWPLAVKDDVAVATRADPQGEKAYQVVYQEDDGKVLWQGRDFLHGIRPVIGINHTSVYIAGPTALIAYATRTGKQLWRQEMMGNIVGVDDHTVTIGMSGGSYSAACLDAVTGSINWTVRGSSDGWRPVLQTSAVLYGVTSPSLHLIAVSRTNGAQLWHAEFASYYVDSIAQEQGVVFAYLFVPPNALGESRPSRLVALDGSRGTVYWERDQQIYALVNTPL
jgi:outer membrane protein assembly factor BamB